MWRWLGEGVPFAETARLQEELRSSVHAGHAPETLLLLEHAPVVTLGRSADPRHLLVAAETLAAGGTAVARANRGGDVTWHGPGQLVGYPVFRLPHGVVDHVARMAAAIVDVLAELGIVAAFDRQRPGVWAGGAKICAFGVHVRRRIAIHGFALNLRPAPDAFASIVPCGLADANTTSIAALVPDAPLRVFDLVPGVVRAIAARFDIDLRRLDR